MTDAIDDTLKSLPQRPGDLLARTGRMQVPYLIDPNTGFESCRYTMYNMSSPWIINEHEVTVPLEQLNDETPSLQYQGLMNERGAEGKAVIDQARIRIAEKTGASTTQE